MTVTEARLGEKPRARDGARAPTRRDKRRAVPSPVHRHDARLAWVLIAPALVGFILFAVYPTLRGIYLSFTSFHVLSPPQWTGLENIRRLLRDGVFWNSLLVTVYFVALSVVIGTFFSVLTAVVLHRLTRSTVIRGLIILPFMISGVVAATTWSWLMNPQLGILNTVITHIIGHPILFLGSRAWVIPSVALISVWKSMGYNAIIIFAGLQTIPSSIYEAGRIDGASETKMLRHLTLPLLRPILAMVLILTVIGSFQVFDIVQVTTRGGPVNASNVLQLYIYQQAFGQFNFGYAATMSMALFVMLMVITFLQVRLLRASESDMS
ncbi:sugar ABC transporter permease [Actinoallomurus purpureus]|uniref:carbohydrate ABC transporter permease n=1 Tax=Actinoallomurus purpureus TaxID=478114 RepID=UPI0020938FED|nr:sugar ABC transporter permease [Actinoallomurus purpureus]MCO6006987.1 sugar ABC transporter permease [Actinoallomurus purpureus]